MIDRDSRAQSLRATMEAGQSAEMLQGALYGASFASFEGWCRGHQLGYDAVTDPLGTANNARMAAGSAIFGGLSFMGDPGGTLSNWWNGLTPTEQGSLFGGALLGGTLITKGVPGGRGNKLQPDPDAQGAHTVFKRDPLTKQVTKYETYCPQTNPLNPNPWKSEKRFDLRGDDHYNKKTKQYVSTPHVHDPGVPGDVRPARSDEIPGGR